MRPLPPYDASGPRHKFLEGRPIDHGQPAAIVVAIDKRKGEEQEDASYCSPILNAMEPTAAACSGTAAAAAAARDSPGDKKKSSSSSAKQQASTASSSLKFSMIPPLPASSSVVVDKENNAAPGKKRGATASVLRQQGGGTGGGLGGFKQQSPSSSQAPTMLPPSADDKSVGSAARTVTSSGGGFRRAGGSAASGGGVTPTTSLTTTGALFPPSQQQQQHNYPPPYPHNSGHHRSHIPEPKTSSSALSSPAFRPTTSTSSSSPLRTLSGTKMATSGTSSSSRGVLRYGESADALFGITDGSTDEYRNLCHSIAHGTDSENAGAWRRVLDVASSLPQPAANVDLVRLHRRATSRLSGQRNRDALAIWMSYAKAQLAAGRPDEARLTLRHVRNQRLDGGGDAGDDNDGGGAGAGRECAEYYAVLCDLEVSAGNRKAAKDALLSGIRAKAEPIQELQRRLQQLEEDRGANDVKSKKYTPSPNATGASSKRRKPNAVKGMELLASPTSQTAKNDDAMTDNSNMSMATIAEEESFTSSPNNLDAATKRTGDEMPSQALPLAPNPPHQVTDGPHPLVESSDGEQPSARKVRLPGPLAPIPPFKASAEKAPGTNDTTKRGLKRTSVGEHPASSTGPAKSETNPQPKTSATPLTGAFSSGTKSRPPKCSSGRLQRTGKLGMPKRIDPNNPSGNETDESDSDETFSTRKNDSRPASDVVAAADSKKSSSQKISRLDLGYMWEWDPDQPRTGKLSSSENDTLRDDPPTVDDTAQAPPSLTLGSVVAAATPPAKDHQKRKSMTSTAEKFSLASVEKKKRPSLSSAEVTETTALNQPAKSSEVSALIEKANVDFLPLVKESNMLRVNGVPYAKLGVIGKGGSCKVYRALSKDCSVVAIKKVKLSGMDKRAISGYANEIELLKRLRGKSAIIQMFDSQVDLTRKAIFLVMEIGDADLNHVLQQQSRKVVGSTGKSSTKRRNLNLTFIRLTWQQMLSAVHCIHENRIVHGDLKPANFLFVRGELKLIDFGIAKAIQSDDTTNIYRESQIGTLNYMSPEAIRESGGGQNGNRWKIGRVSGCYRLRCYNMDRLNQNFSLFMHCFPLLLYSRIIIVDGRRLTFGR